MNLKEAFRFQNKLQSLMDQAQEILGNDWNITIVKTTCLRRRTMVGFEDEVRTEGPACEFSACITQVAEFLLYLLSEREKLSAAICAAKASVPFDAGMDGELDLNGRRREIASLLRWMADLRGSETVIANGGTGYCFNRKGNQVPYRFDIKRSVTVNFDRDRIRQMCSDLSKKVDKVSACLDTALINIKVDYIGPFDVNESFADVFEAYACRVEAV
ncbi:MAG: hypothetical protein ACI4P4_09290 [Faecousia sp.]